MLLWVDFLELTDVLYIEGDSGIKKPMLKHSMG